MQLTFREKNIVADFLSRGKYLPAEWVLNRAVFRTICRLFSPPPEIDLFASALNFRLPKYCSRCPDVQAWKIDALSFPWTGLRLYAFPPFTLLPRILDKLAQDEADLLLVAPFWPQRPWFPPPEVLGGPSEDVASTEGLGGATHVLDSSQQGRKSSSFSMASFRQQGEEAGLSQRAAQFAAEAFRQSTRDTYDSRLAPFREWCSKIPCDPSSAPLGAVADFLISRFDKGLTVVTLRSYRSAIASCHRGFSDGSSVSNSKFLTRLFQSFFLKRPPSKTLLPVWSLPAVLKVLASAPFEPLHKASLRLLTLKTAFLVAIASGHRVSSLRALCVDPGHLRWEASGVRLIPRMGFIAKNQSLKSGPVEIFLPAISTLSSVEEDKVWCPVRALKWYVDRTKSIRASSSLFVATIAPHKEVATSTLARWLVECIEMAGTEAILTDRVRAHDTRSVSSSWALFNGACLKDIQQAAFWSNLNSFISCYLKDVVVGEASFAAAVLRTSVSGSSGSGPAKRIP